MKFPRYQKVPAHKKPQTKWEIFAKKKGIMKKKKRSRLVYSEELKDWVPRWGKNSVKKIAEKMNVIREVKPGDEGIDLFQRAKQEKQLAIKKQNLNVFKNQIRVTGLDPNKFVSGKAIKTVKKKKAPRTKRKQILKAQKAQVSVSNASLGKFDHNTNEEKEIRPVRRRQKIFFKNITEENKRNKDLLRKMMMKG